MIRDPVKYCAALWQWDFMLPVFHGTLIRVADLDGMLDADGIDQKHGYVERCGHHLVFETTVPPDREMTKGQLISHASLVKVGFSIVYLWGPPNCFPIHQVQIWKEFTEHAGDRLIDVSQVALVGWVRRWFMNATDNPITPPLAPEFFARPAALQRRGAST
jgi:hypothetical protein